MKHHIGKFVGNVTIVNIYWDGQKTILSHRKRPIGKTYPKNLKKEGEIDRGGPPAKTEVRGRSYEHLDLARVIMLNSRVLSSTCSAPDPAK